MPTAFLLNCVSRHAAALLGLGLCTVFGAACKTGSSQGSGGSDGEGGSGGQANQQGGNAGGGSAGSASGGSAGSNVGGGGAGVTPQSGKGGGGMAAMGGRGGAAVAVDYFVYASGGSQIETFKFNIETGALVSVEKINSGSSTTYLAFHPNGKTLYATNEAGSGVVKAFSIAKGTGKLTANGMQPSGGNNAVHVSVHPSGKWLLVANYGGDVSVFPLNQTTGAIEAASDTMDTPNESHQIMADRTGKFVFVPCRSDNSLYQLKLDQVMGKLTKNTPEKVMSADPRHVVFHPTNKFVFLINENNSSLITYALNADTGLLESKSTLALAGEQRGSHVEVSPDGKFLFAGQRDKNAIGSFSIDQTTGALALVDTVTMSISKPRDFTISPTGQHLLVGTEDKGTLTVVKIAPDGKLTTVGTPTPAPSSSVVVVPVPKT